MERLCAYEPCDKVFEARTHNQIYCSDEHCKLATNARIMEKYYENKRRRQGYKRICKTPGCNTPLSRYNPEEICSKCQSERKAAQNKKMLQLFRDD